MNYTKLMAIITAVGEDKIAGFVFDNSGRKVFNKGEFSVATMIDESLECLVLKEKDVNEIEYTVYKPIELIQSIMVVDDAEKLNKLERRYIAV